MDPSSTQHLPAQAQKPSSNVKADQLVWRFLRKFVSVVADARIISEEHPDPQDALALLSSDHEEAASAPTQRANTAGTPAPPPAEGAPINSTGTPARLEVDKWFNLENSAVDTFKPALDIFKHISTTFPFTPVETAIEPPPLIVQVLLSLPQSLPDDQVLILNHGDHQIRIENSPRYILLESWRVDITRRVPESHDVPSSTSASASLSARDSSSFEDLNLPVTYKQCIALFRSLYTLLRILPTWRLHRQLREMQAGSGGGMTFEMRVGVSSASSSATSSTMDLTPAIDGSAIVDFDHALSERHPSANGVQSMALPSVPSPLGNLRLSLKYRSETDFTLKSLPLSDLAPTSVEADHFSQPERASTPLNQPSNSPIAGTQLNHVISTESFSTLSSNPGAEDAVPLPQRSEAGERPIPRPLTPPEDDESDFLAAFSSTVAPAQQRFRDNLSLGVESTTSGPSSMDKSPAISDIQLGYQNAIPSNRSSSGQPGFFAGGSFTRETQPYLRRSKSSDDIAGRISFVDLLPSKTADLYSDQLPAPALPSLNTMTPTSHAGSPHADVLGTQSQSWDSITFRGEEGQCERFVLFIQEAARNHGKLDDPKWSAAFASTCLTGDALRWYNGLDEDTQDSWELLAPALLNKFSGPTLDRQLKENTGSAGWGSSIPIPGSSLSRRLPEESGSSKPYSPTLDEPSPTSAAVWPPQPLEGPLDQPRDGLPNSGFPLGSSVPQEIDPLQELDSIESNSTPSTKYIVDLILAIGKATPKAIRNKHQLYRLLIRSRELCDHLHCMLHTEVGSSVDIDIFKQCWEMMDRLECALLDLTNIVVEEMVPFGESSLATWGDSCKRLRQLDSELTAPPFNGCGIRDSVHTNRDRYFDDCSWLSLILVEGIEVPVQNMYPRDEGIPFEAQDVIDRLNYLVNEMKLNGNIDEQTRELFIKVISDTAKVVMNGSVEASLAFWKAATSTLGAIDPENHFDQGMVEALQESWSGFVDHRIRPPLTPRSLTEVNPHDHWLMKFHNYASQVGIVWSLTTVEKVENDHRGWMAMLTVAGEDQQIFTGGPALEKREAKDMAARLALIAFGIIISLCAAAEMGIGISA